MPPPQFDYSGSGTWTVSIDVQEAVGISQDSFPTSGSFDPPPATQYQLMEILVPGGSWSASATYMGLSVGVSGTTLSTIGITEVAYQVQVSSFINSGCPPNGSNDATASVAILTPVMYGLPYTDSFSNSYFSGSANCNGANATVSCTSNSQPSSLGASSSVSAVFAPPRSWNLSGVLREMVDAYSDTLQMEVSGVSSLFTNPVDISSSFQCSDTQRYGSVSAAVYQLYGSYTYTYSNNNPYSIDELGPISLSIVPSSLSLNGDDPNDTRLMFRGWMWDACNISQNSITAVDPSPIDTNWTAGEYTTLSPGLTITISNSGTGSISSTLNNNGQAPESLLGTNWEGVSFQGYRYLRVYLTCQLQPEEMYQTATVEIGSKSWDLEVIDSGYIDIDLCAPSSATQIVDSQDSKWPYTSTSPVIISDGPFWGVSNVTNLQINNLASGHVYTLTKIELVRLNHLTCNFIGGYEDWVPLSTSGSNATYYRRFFDGDSDGRRYPEISDYEYTIGPETDIYYTHTFLDMIQSLYNGNNGVYTSDGWTATDLQPLPPTGCPDSNGYYQISPCYLNSSAPLFFAYGAGALFNGKNWVYGLDQSASNGLTIPAQTVFDSIQFYPSCGNPWELGTGSYNTALPLYAAKILRSQAYGLVLDNNHNPAPNVTVNVTLQNTSNSVGTGITDSRGEYKTANPYPPGTSTCEVTAESGPIPYPVLQGIFISRKRQRFCFSGVPVPPCCSLVFCSNDFLFPYRILAGDSDLLPLEKWRAIPTVRDDGSISSLIPSSVTTKLIP